MDKDEALREISCAIKSLGLANRVLIESGAIEDEEDIEDAKGIIYRAKEGVDYLAKQSPAHPAIPEEVRETVLSALGNLAADRADGYCVPTEEEEESARTWLAKCPNPEPSKPAIPEEVRETIEFSFSAWLHAAIDAQKDGGERSVEVAEGRVASARDWLAKCPEATDRAVCPKCGESDECTWAGIDKIRCWRCRHDFSVQVLVLSPPREPKRCEVCGREGAEYGCCTQLSEPKEEHDEFCDSVMPGPDLGPSTKPCNCKREPKVAP